MERWNEMTRKYIRSLGHNELSDVFSRMSASGDVEWIAGKRFATPKHTREPYSLFSFGGVLLVGLFSSLLVCAGGQAIAGRALPIMAVICILPLVFLVAISLAFYREKQRFRLMDQAAQEAGLGRWFVRVSCFPSGSSYGWLWREGAYLQFSGDRYDFSISASDFLTSKNLDKRLCCDPGAPICPIPGLGSIRVSILLLERPKNTFSLRRCSPEFLKEIHIWSEAKSNGSGISTYPPIRIAYPKQSSRTIVVLALLYGLAAAVPISFLPTAVPDVLSMEQLWGTAFGMFFFGGMFPLSELSSCFRANKRDAKIAELKRDA